MSDATRILLQMDSGDPAATEKLLPLVYDELRQLAAMRLAQEKPGQTLLATALVHEAYLRLVGGGQSWDGRGHFFAAAAEAMRRILVEQARRKGRERHGGGLARHDVDDLSIAAPAEHEDLLALDEALSRLEAQNPQAARLVKLRYFAGLTNKQAADAMSLSPRRTTQIWAYARSWLLAELSSASPANRD